MNATTVYVGTAMARPDLGHTNIRPGLVCEGKVSPTILIRRDAWVAQCPEKLCWRDKFDPSIPPLSQKLPIRRHQIGGVARNCRLYQPQVALVFQSDVGDGPCTHPYRPRPKLSKQLLHFPRRG